jgi:hypothetical protein
MIAIGIITLRLGRAKFFVATGGRETRLPLPVGSLATACSFLLSVRAVVIMSAELVLKLIWGYSNTSRR